MILRARLWVQRQVSRVLARLTRGLDIATKRFHPGGPNDWYFDGQKLVSGVGDQAHVSYADRKPSAGFSESYDSVRDTIRRRRREDAMETAFVADFVRRQEAERADKP